MALTEIGRVDSERGPLIILVDADSGLITMRSPDGRDDTLTPIQARAFTDQLQAAINDASGRGSVA